MDLTILKYFLRKLGVLSNTGEAPAPLVVASTAPNNADGRPDGTVYIQTS